MEGSPDEYKIHVQTQHREASWACRARERVAWNFKIPVYTHGRLTSLQKVVQLQHKQKK